MCLAAAVGSSGGAALLSRALGLSNEYEDVTLRDGNKMLPMDGTSHPLTAQFLSYIKVRHSTVAATMLYGC